MTTISEFTVEEAALSWFGELGYAIAHGPDMAPGEAAAERDTFGEVVLVGRLREAIAEKPPGHTKALTLFRNTRTRPGSERRKPLYFNQLLL